MMKTIPGMALLVLWAAGQGGLAPDTWVNEGDMDGDGLKDEFEVRHGLDPTKTESFADGIPDEDRLAPDGRTMWDLQNAESSTPVAGAGSGGACGALGAEGVALAGLLVLLLRRSLFHPKSGNNR